MECICTLVGTLGCWLATNPLPQFSRLGIQVSCNCLFLSCRYLFDLLVCLVVQDVGGVRYFTTSTVH